ncbi:MAG TPA: hypothetical protein VEQ09_02510 [Aquabacterium sp.]|nr:hypothetical protein [Aquabacterium sp.]
MTSSLPAAADATVVAARPPLSERPATPHRTSERTAGHAAAPSAELPRTASARPAPRARPDDDVALIEAVFTHAGHRRTAPPAKDEPAR